MDDDSSGRVTFDELLGKGLILSKSEAQLTAGSDGLDEEASARLRPAPSQERVAPKTTGSKTLLCSWKARLL